VKLSLAGARPRPAAGLVAAGVALLVVLAFWAGYATARHDALGALLARGTWPAAGRGGQTTAPLARVGQADPADARPPADLEKQFQPFWEAWNFAEKESLRQPVDRARLIQGAIKGMLGALNDPYAAYLDQAGTRVEKAHLDGLTEGIGASLELRDRRHIIIAPLDDSPAARAGLRSGDVILRVDGKEIGSLNLAEAVALLRGPAGTKVKLTVLRADDPDGQPVELELTRARIELESVSARMAAEGIGYVRVRLFGTQTVPQLTRALRDMRARRVRGLVLDLRDNPGGYLSGAVDVASQFLKEGSVVVYEERDGKRLPAVARGGGLATDLTLAVLVNKGSASASEIVAGAIRDHNRGVLIGEPTFGKGSVQLPRDLSDGSSVRVTVATWLTPSGRLIHGQGLAPAIEARPTPEDEKAKRDVALEKALEWFRVAPPAAEAGASG
jgi:carboxyl-terminal processing protease